MKKPAIIKKHKGKLTAEESLDMLENLDQTLAEGQSQLQNGLQ